MNLREWIQQNEALRPLLISRLAEKAPELLEKMEGHNGIENDVYRFYHQSCTVYGAQVLTLEAVELLQSLLPERPLTAWFMQIVKGARRRSSTSRTTTTGRSTRVRF
jgi:hypothetical protein